MFYLAFMFNQRDTPDAYSKFLGKAILAVIAGLVVVASPRAAERFSERDIAMLPDYCRYRMDEQLNPAETVRYERLVGPMFWHIHHYCYGLAYTNQVLLGRLKPQERNHLLSQSIFEFDYVISRAPADFVLLPEILTKRGENMLRLRRIQEGVSTLQRAIDKKPDYWPPYAVLSDHYKASGDMEKARQWLEKGIAASPDAKALKTRQLELKR